MAVQGAVIFRYDEDGDFAEGPAPVSGGKGKGDLSQEEGMMANRRQARSNAAIGLIFFTILLYGCAERQAATRDLVTTEYFLTEAGFQQYKPNMETPKTQALLDALPQGQISTFRGNGRVYHAYPDVRSNILYVGDQAAYEKYVSMARGRSLCQRVDAPSSSGFWSCYQELQSVGAVPKGQ